MPGYLCYFLPPTASKIGVPAPHLQVCSRSCVPRPFHLFLVKQVAACLLDIYLARKLDHLPVEQRLGKSSIPILGSQHILVLEWYFSFRPFENCVPQREQVCVLHDIVSIG